MEKTFDRLKIPYSHLTRKSSLSENILEKFVL